jgi:hypothetical protein
MNRKERDLGRAYQSGREVTRRGVVGEKNLSGELYNDRELTRGERMPPWYGLVQSAACNLWRCFYGGTGEDEVIIIALIPRLCFATRGVSAPSSAS